MPPPHQPDFPPLYMANVGAMELPVGYPPAMQPENPVLAPYAAELEAAGILHIDRSDDGRVAYALTPVGERIARERTNSSDAIEVIIGLSGIARERLAVEPVASAADLNSGWRGYLLLPCAEQADAPGCPVDGTAGVDAISWACLSEEEQERALLEAWRAVENAEDVVAKKAATERLDALSLASSRVHWDREEAVEDADRLLRDYGDLIGPDLSWLWRYLNTRPDAWQQYLVNTVHDAFESIDIEVRDAAIAVLRGIEVVEAKAYAALLRQISGLRPPETAIDRLRREMEELTTDTGPGSS